MTNIKNEEIKEEVLSSSSSSSSETKSVKPLKKEVVEEIKIRIQDKCEWCGKGGYVREVVFCSEMCKDSFLAAHPDIKLLAD